MVSLDNPGLLTKCDVVVTVIFKTCMVTAIIK